MKNIFFTLATLIISITAGKTQCNHPDYAGLMEVYYSTGGPNWTKNTGWKEGAASTNCNPCGGWRGITCINNRVTGINLAANNLVGVIPNFTNGTVQYFVFSKNDMSLSTDVWKKLRTINPAISLHICG